MSRHFVAARATGIGSVTLPMLSLYAPAGSGGTIKEIGVFNAAAVAVELYIRRLTTAGTQGAGLTEGSFDDDTPAPAMTGFAVHTVNPTLGEIIRAPILGAAIGSGVIFTFSGIRIAPGTGNGVGIILATGIGQLVTAHFDWEE